jgi:hypothetical protein
LVSTSGKQLVAIFVDRSSRQWVVRDPDGNFWSLPAREDPWDHRQPFALGDGTDLEPVPGHYKNMLGVPF